MRSPAFITKDFPTGSQRPTKSTHLNLNKGLSSSPKTWSNKNKKWILSFSSLEEDNSSKESMSSLNKTNSTSRISQFSRGAHKKLWAPSKKWINSISYLMCCFLSKIIKEFGQKIPNPYKKSCFSTWESSSKMEKRNWWLKQDSLRWRGSSTLQFFSWWFFSVWLQS